MKLASVVALMLGFSSVCFAGAPGASGVAASTRFSDTRLHSQTARDVPLALVPGTYPQEIDHAAPGQTFEQRYWVDSEYATDPTDAPVIYHICGEGDATQGYFLNDNAIEWAKTLHANLVYLEHRYYGESQPFADLSTDHLKFLTLDNVIEDLATFQKWLTTSRGWKGKWISVGGSYSGTLSALYRQAHPELVVGALAASAPMISGVGESSGTQLDVSGLSSTETSNDGRSWVYQSCTKFGFWLADGPAPGATLMEPSPWLCQQLFGDVALFDATAYNQKFDAPFLADSSAAPTNILFSYGTDDIWTTLGLSTQTNANPAITIELIDGAGHHEDLNAPDPSDSAAIVNARSEFVALATKWLAQ